MKKIILISIVTANFTTVALAQKKERKSEASSLDKSLLSFQLSAGSFPGHSKFGITYIRSNKPSSVIRFGLRYDYQRNFSYQTVQVQDTLFTSTYLISNKKITLSFGKEWRYNLHKDVQLFGGFDGQLSAVSDNDRYYYTKLYNGVTTTLNSYGSRPNPRFNLGVKPFAGVRAYMGRFGAELSGEFTKPFTIFQDPYFFLNQNQRTFKANVNLVYRLGKKGS
jgi:hypothetical protein